MAAIVFHAVPGSKGNRPARSAGCLAAVFSVGQTLPGLVSPGGTGTGALFSGWPVSRLVQGLARGSRHQQQSPQISSLLGIWTASMEEWVPLVRVLKLKGAKRVAGPREAVTPYAETHTHNWVGPCRYTQAYTRKHVHTHMHIHAQIPLQCQQGRARPQFNLRSQLGHLR